MCPYLGLTPAEMFKGRKQEEGTGRAGTQSRRNAGARARLIFTGLLRVVIGIENPAEKVDTVQQRITYFDV